MRLLTNQSTVAIGGIQGARVASVLATGVGSVALVTAITQASDPEQVTRELLAQVGVGAWEPGHLQLREVADV